MLAFSHQNAEMRCLTAVSDTTVPAAAAWDGGGAHMQEDVVGIEVTMDDVLEVHKSHPARDVAEEHAVRGIAG